VLAVIEGLHDAMLTEFPGNQCVVVATGRCVATLQPDRHRNGMIWEADVDLFAEAADGALKVIEIGDEEDRHPVFLPKRLMTRVGLPAAGSRRYLAGMAVSTMVMGMMPSLDRSAVEADGAATYATEQVKMTDLAPVEAGTGDVQGRNAAEARGRGPPGTGQAQTRGSV
jgi:hypothetical protein